MDISEMFPEAAAPKESTLFSKHSDTIDFNAAIADDKVDDKKVEEPADKADAKAAPAKTTEVHGTPAMEDLTISNEEFESAKDGSRSGLLEFFKTKIEAGEINPFDDYDDKKQTLDEYLKDFKAKDFDELWKSNQQFKEQELVSKVPQEFFDSLPEELQYAARYVNDGGTDIKGLFKALGEVQEVKALDPVKDAKLVCQNYLTAKEFGTPEEIAAQLEEWEDLGVIDTKSKSFKPKLDQMQDVIVQQKLAAQTQLKAQQVEQYNFYNNSVREALLTEDLGGIKIDKKTQVELFNGLTEGAFTDSRGKRCTEFEHLLDKIMWQEPDYKKLAKIHWILKDEAAYEKAVSLKATNANVEETVRELKTLQSKNTSATIEEVSAKKTMIPRKTGLFKRS